MLGCHLDCLNVHSLPALCPLGHVEPHRLLFLQTAECACVKEATPRQPLPSKATFREGCMCAKYRFLSLLLVTLFLLFFSPILANAECASPDNPGVRICSPTANAAVVYIPSIDFNTTPDFGTSIVKFSVYDNNRKTWEDSSGLTGETLIDATTKNGLHTVVVNAWDSSGKLYQGRVSFRVTGDGFPFFCAAPSAPGINFCEPPASATLSTRYSVSATAKSNSSIAAMRLYVDGQAEDTQSHVSQFNSTASVHTQGDHRISIVAWDNSGHVFRNTRTLHSAYTYGYFDCPPKGNDPCTPGFSPDGIAPQQDSYVGSSFTIMANILQNPRPITTMKAYIDDAIVATSAGPTMASRLENAPNGTHILTLQAWDTQGVMYRIQYNININVPH
jgi:hypothetical protein